MTASTHLTSRPAGDDATSQTLRPVVAKLLVAIEEYISAIDRAARQLKFLRDFAQEQSGSPSELPQPAKLNAYHFVATRNELYKKCFEGGLQAVDAARMALVPVLERGYPETALRISSKLQSWSMRGLDLLRPPHIMEMDLFVTDRESLSKWRIDAEDLRLELRGVMSLDSRSPHGEAGWITVSELARQFNVGCGALRKRLERFRRKQPDGWRSISDAKQREPRYFYSLSAVTPIVEKMKAKRPSKRPAKKSSTSK